MSFSSGKLSADGLILTIDFIGGRPFAPDDRCSNDYKGWAEASGDVLQAAVVDVTPVRAVAACDAVGFSRSVSVPLPEPFLGSRLKDLGGYLHFLRAPDALVELDLPANWLLRSQEDVQESPTGRWSRTYSPFANPDRGRSKGKVDLIQAFGGPANVTGGDERRMVTVNGHPAELYRYPPEGELVLVWRLGDDGLALVANETDFPVPELIRLAESAARH